MHTNIQHLLDKTLTLPIHEHLQLHASQYKQKTQHPSHPLHKHTTYFNTTRILKTLFLTTADTQQTSHRPLHSHYTRHKTNMRHIHTSIVSRHLEAIIKYCAHLHHTLAALKTDFPASLIAPLPNSEQTNLSSSNHTYTKSTPNHIHHHYAPFATLTHTTHTISSTAPTYAPHCHPWSDELVARWRDMLARWRDMLARWRDMLARWRDMLAGGPKAG